MSTKEKKNKALSQVAAKKVMVADKRKDFNKKKTAALDSYKEKKGKIVEFLTDFITILVGFMMLVDTIVDTFTYYMAKIEAEIKKGLKVELKSIVSCGLDPSIPDFLKSGGNGIIIEVKKIDFFDLFMTDPTSKAGKLMYQNPVNNNIDFNTFLYNSIQSDGLIQYWPNSTNPILEITFNSNGNGTTIPNNSLKINASVNYSSKKLTDLNNDFIDSITLFNTQGIINRILDSIYGSISFSINKSKKQLENEARINTVIDKIIDSDANDVINDDYFTFTNDETFEHEKEATLRQQGIHKLELSTPINASIPIDMLSDLNNQLNIPNISPLEQKTIITNNMLKMASVTTVNNIPNIPPIPNIPNIPPMPTIPAVPDNVSIKLNFTSEIFKSLTKTIVSSVISPKVIIIFLINLKIVYGANATYIDGVDFIKKNKNIFRSLIKGISSIIIKILLTLALKEIAKLMAKVIIKKRIEKTTHRKEQMLSLLGGASKQAIEALKNSIA